MIFLPLYDDNEQGYLRFRSHFVNNGIILFCIGIFLYESDIFYAHGSSALGAFLKSNTFNPASSLGDAYLSLSPMHRVSALFARLMHMENSDLLNLLKSTFFHASPLHLAGNIFVLWMLGDNVEYAMGHIRYLLFFLVTAILSQFGELIMATQQNFVSGIGASGAIMAVSGAYLLYFPRARINFFYCYAIIFDFWPTYGVTDCPARVVLFFYYIYQLILGIVEYGTNYDNIAIWCHVFGFVSGITLALLLRVGRNEEFLLYTPGKSLRYKRVIKPGGPESDMWGDAR